jgi:hypothetical protein
VLVLGVCGCPEPPPAAPVLQIPAERTAALIWADIESTHREIHLLADRRLSLQAMAQIEQRAQVMSELTKEMESESPPGVDPRQLELRGQMIRLQIQKLEMAARRAPKFLSRTLEKVDTELERYGRLFAEVPVS